MRDADELRALLEQPRRARPGRAGPRRSIGAQSSSAPFSWATWYQGTTFEWCSISVTTIRSPAERLVAAPRVGDEVEGLGRVADEDHLAPVGAEVGRDRRAGVLVERRSPPRRACDAAVDVGVVLAPVAIQRLDHRERLLCGGAVVEVGERLAVDLPSEDRELGADLLDGPRQGGGACRRRLHRELPRRPLRPRPRRLIQP